jgi:hypothetical protein
MIPDFDELPSEAADDDRAQNIGKCKKCQYFDVEREKEPATDETLAPCLHPDMEEFELIVSGDSGCNLFEMCEDLDDDENIDGAGASDGPISDSEVFPT